MIYTFLFCIIPPVAILCGVAIIIATMRSVIVSEHARQVELERKRRLVETKIRLEDARVAKMENDVVLSSFRVEDERAKRGLDNPFIPTNYP